MCYQVTMATWNFITNLTEYNKNKMVNVDTPPTPSNRLQTLFMCTFFLAGVTIAEFEIRARLLEEGGLHEVESVFGSDNETSTQVTLFETSLRVNGSSVF